MTDGWSCALPDLEATARVARALAARAAPGDVICLAGDLGTGKTTFARAYLAALGVGDEVPSPTFNLVLVYDTAVGPVWHFDLYRLSDPREAIELGIDEALTDAVSLIEWPERLGPMVPADRVELGFFQAAGGGRRSLTMRCFGTARDRYAELDVVAN